MTERRAGATAARRPRGRRIGVAVAGGTGRLSAVALLAFPVAASATQAGPAARTGPDPMPLAEKTVAVQPGLGFGGSVGVNGFGGSANGPIGRGVGWEFFARAGTRSGLFVRGGMQRSRHRVAAGAAPLKFSSFFVEPRYVGLGLSGRWAPFITGRLGRLSEQLEGPTYTFESSGHTIAGGLGMAVRLADQIALEGGLMVGSTSFGTYTFRGELAWKDCLDALADGTPLPESVSRCAGSRSIGGIIIMCYPPYFPRSTADCAAPEIPFEGTARGGTWLRPWIGVNLSLSAPRS